MSQNNNKSLTDLGVDIPSTSIQSSLVKACFIALETPICELENNDLRMLITQSIGLEFLIPRALELLEAEPFLSGGLYQGDMLAAVLSAPTQYWDDNKELNNRLVELKFEVEEILETINEEILPTLDKFEFK